MQKLTGQYKKWPGNNQGACFCNPLVGGAAVPGVRSGKGLHRAAFFDVDGTLIQGDTQEMEARYLLKNSRPSPGYLWSIFRTLAAIQLNRLGWISLSRQNKVYLKSYRGRTRKELICQAQDMFDHVVCKQFFPRSLEILEKHRQQGDMIVLVSATTRHLLIPFKETIQPDMVFCTDLEFDARGICTGHAKGKICAEKEKVSKVLEFARQHHIDLTSSFAYSDHHSDIPFLSCVGHPSVVNPTNILTSHAWRMGWPVHKFFMAKQ